jgi:type II secretory pathway pseudopilin PulG
MRFVNRHPARPCRGNRRSPRARGISLLELMVSIALVLILILGINEVFGLSSRTVGAGQALSDAHRDARNAQATLFDDARGAAAALPDAPFLLIRSQGVYAFRDKPDLDADADQDPSTEERASAPNAPVYAYETNNRRHRLDQLQFFARGLLHRQTGTDGSFTDPNTSYEAYIVYGHLLLPVPPDPSDPTKANTLPNNIGALSTPPAGQPIPPNTGAYRYPGDSTKGNAVSQTTPANWQTQNPNNYFASQWILGRSVFLLDPNPPATLPPVKPYFVQNSPVLYAPLAPPSRDGTSSFQYQLWQSRYDLCQTSIDLYRQYMGGFPIGTKWWQFLTACNPTDPLDANSVTVRHLADPRPLRPLDSAAAARSSPCFLRGCTQFIVEYAGDFCTQDPNPLKRGAPVKTGTNTANPPESISAPDGEIDYVLDGDVRKVRWYGFPRDTNDDGAINWDQDVVPLSHFLQAPNGFGLPAPVAVPAWERWGTAPPAGNDYTKMGPDDYFIAAWGPDTQNSPKPTMLRITVVLDDPDGRMGAGQSYEYILKLQ